MYLRYRHRYPSELEWQASARMNKVFLYFLMHNTTSPFTSPPFPPRPGRRRSCSVELSWVFFFHFFSLIGFWAFGGFGGLLVSLHWYRCHYYCQYHHHYHYQYHYYNYDHYYFHYYQLILIRLLLPLALTAWT